MIIINLLKEFLKQHKIYLFIYFFLVIFNYPFENIVVPRIYSSFFNTVNSRSKNSVYYKYLIYLVTALTIVNIAGFFVNKIETHLLPKLESYLNNNVFDYIFKTNQQDYNDISSASFINKMNNIPHSIISITNNFIKYILPESISILIINVYFYYVNWRLGFVTTIIFIAYIFYYKIMFNNCLKTSINKHRIKLQVKEKIEDKISNMFSIFSNGKLYDEIKTNRQINDINSYTIRESMKCYDSLKLFNQNYTIFILVVLNVTCVYMYKKKMIDHTLLISLFFTIMFFPKCLDTFGWAIPDINENYSILLGEADLLKNLIAHDTKLKKNKLIIKDGHIVIRNIYFSYTKDDNYLFSDFNLDILPGEKVALLGNSGNGKSTLIKLITGYYKIQKGDITIDGQNIQEYDLNELRKSISYVNQNNKLFNISVIKNIQYGNNMTRDDITRLIDRLHILGIFKNLPRGLDTTAGINGDKLSGGQKQIIHILRCIGKNNKIVILDEPTSNIDVHHTEYVIKAIQELSVDKTLIIITHEDVLLKLVNRHIYLESGKIIKDTKMS